MHFLDTFRAGIECDIASWHALVSTIHYMMGLRSLGRYRVFINTCLVCIFCGVYVLSRVLVVEMPVDVRTGQYLLNFVEDILNFDALINACHYKRYAASLLTVAYCCLQPRCTGNIPLRLPLSMCIRKATEKTSILYPPVYSVQAVCIVDAFLLFCTDQ